MMRIWASLVLTITLLVLPLYACAQDSVDAIEKAVSEQWDKLSALSGTFDLTASFKLKPEQATPMNLVGGGTVDYAKTGQSPLYKGFLWAGFSPTGRLLQAQALWDGQAGRYEALAPLFKLNSSGPAALEDIVPPGGRGLFAAIRKNLAAVTACPAETVNGAECYVLTAAPKEVGDSPIAGLKMWLAKATGALHQVMLVDAAGAQVALLAMKDVKVNGPANPEAFKFVSLAPPAPPAPPAAPAPPAENK